MFWRDKINSSISINFFSRRRQFRSFRSFSSREMRFLISSSRVKMFFFFSIFTLFISNNNNISFTTKRFVFFCCFRRYHFVVFRFVHCRVRFSIYQSFDRRTLWTTTKRHLKTFRLIARDFWTNSKKMRVLLFYESKTKTLHVSLFSRNVWIFQRHDSENQNAIAKTQKIDQFRRMHEILFVAIIMQCVCKIRNR